MSARSPHLARGWQAVSKLDSERCRFLSLLVGTFDEYRLSEVAGESGWTAAPELKASAGLHAFKIAALNSCSVYGSCNLCFSSCCRHLEGMRHIEQFITATFEKVLFLSLFQHGCGCDPGLPQWLQNAAGGDVGWHAWTHMGPCGASVTGGSGRKARLL